MRISPSSVVFAFPFIGAGNASYFEWAEVHVIFEQVPTDEQKTKIAAYVPEPIDDLRWEGNTLTASSDQFTHTHIASSYQTDDGLDPENEENWTDGRWFFAASSQVSAFNEHIESWLQQIHQESPIQLAFRAEDGESGGTEFSEWHDWSVAKIESLLPRFSDIFKTVDKESIRSHVLCGLLTFKEQESALDSIQFDYLYPGRRAIDAFLNDDPSLLSKLFEDSPAEKEEILESFVNSIDESNPTHQRIVSKHCDLILENLQSFPDDDIPILNKKLWFIGFEQDNQRILAKIPGTKALGGVIAYAAYTSMTSGEFQKSIALFEHALIFGSLDLSLYCNALYVLQKDNTGLAIDLDRNQRFLEICLSFGGENPDIYFNASGVYIEMDQLDDARNMVKLAVEKKCQSLNDMKKQIKTDGFYEGLREETDVLTII